MTDFETEQKSQELFAAFEEMAQKQIKELESNKTFLAFVDASVYALEDAGNSSNEVFKAIVDFISVQVNFFCARMYGSEVTAFLQRQELDEDDVDNIYTMDMYRKASQVLSIIAKNIKKKHVRKIIFDAAKEQLTLHESE